MTQGPAYDLVVGIDIAAASAAVVELPRDGTPSRPRSITQTPASHTALLEHLLSTGLPLRRILVVMEATSTVLDRAGHYAGPGRSGRQGDQPDPGTRLRQSAAQALQE